MQEQNYFTLPFYKKWIIDLKKFLKNKKENFKFPLVPLIALLIITLILGLIIIIVVTGKKEFPTKDQYDKTGFVNYDDLNEKQTIIENGNYQFVMNNDDTHFTLLDKQTNKLYESKPENLTKADTLTVYYSGSLGTPTKYGNYNYSINYEKQHRYAIRTNDNSVEVLYLLGGKVKIDYTDFPQLLSQEKFEINILQKANEYVNQLKESKDPEYLTYKTYLAYLNNYKLNTEFGYYAMTNKESLTELALTGLYEIFYNVCGYTKEDLDSDNLEYGVVNEKTYPTFEVSIKYTLENEGLKVEVINESIVDYEQYPLIYIDILPYFCAATSEESGYSLIPDGSGAILDFNNNRQYASNYEQRIYGNDLAKSSKIMENDNTKISLGVYGMKIDDENSSKGMINIVENGAECCSVVATMNQEGNTNGYNQTFYRAYFRETDVYRFESLSGLSDIQTWTNEFNDATISLLIKPLQGDSTYVDMANEYQQYLLNNQKLKEQDTTNNVGLNLTLIGGYLEQKNILGIKYEKVQSLTTSAQLEELALKLKNDGINNLNVIYQGFYNDGLYSKYNGKTNFNNAITSKKKLSLVQSNLEKENISLYPMFNFVTTYTDKNVSNKNLVRNQYGSIVANYQNMESLYLKDMTTTAIHYLKPNTYKDTFAAVRKLVDNIKVQNLAFSDLGSLMYGSYQSTDMNFKSQTVKYFNELMAEYGSEYNYLFSNPNDYAIPYASVITDVPYSATEYAIFKYSVPFYQLVMSGYVDYSGESINMSDEYTFDYYKMKSIETLSNLSMTWTYERTTDLIETEYNYLYSTYYNNWYDKTITLYEELMNLGIYNSKLVNHEYIYNTDIVKTIYSNGVEIVLNYSNADYIYNGVTINANNYKVVKEGR